MDPLTLSESVREDYALNKGMALLPNIKFLLDEILKHKPIDISYFKIYMKHEIHCRCKV